jgi:hypothetical protein
MHEGPEENWGRRLYALGLAASGWAALPPWSVGWFLCEAEHSVGGKHQR